MTVLLPLIGLVVLVLSLVLEADRSGKFNSRWSAWIAVAVAVGIGLAGIYRLAPAAQQGSLVFGLLIGVASGIVAFLVDHLKPGGGSLIALAASAASVLLIAKDHGAVQASLACPVGAAIIALCLGSRSAALLTVLVTAICGGQVTGTYAGASFAFPSSAAILGLGLGLIGLLGASLKRMFGKIEFAWPVLSTFLAVGVAYACSQSYLSLDKGWLALGIAPIAALISAAMQPGENATSPYSVILSSVIWIGIATVAFGLARAFGITLAFVLGAGMLVLLKSDRGLMAAGPLMALALHRVFRAIHPDVSQSIDIGQHYALVGLCLGALIPLLPEEWLAKAKDVSSWRLSTGALLWTVIAFATPALLALFLAPKGLLGFVTGLGLSGFFAALMVTCRPAILALAGGLAMLAVIEYGWLSELATLQRDEKLHWFMLSAVGLALVAVVLALLSKSKTKPQPA